MYYLIKQEIQKEETRQTCLIENEIGGVVGISCSFTLNGFILVKAQTIEEAEIEILKRKLMMALFSEELGISVSHLAPDFDKKVFSPLKVQLHEKLKSNNTDIKLEMNLVDVEDIRWGLNLRIPLETVGVHQLGALESVDYSYMQALEYFSISETEFKFLKQQFGEVYGQCLLVDTKRMLIDNVMYQVELIVKE